MKNDTSPRNQAALLWNAKPRPVPVSVPGEPLFAFSSGHRQYRCELRTVRGYGVEAQFLLDGELLTARTLPSRDLAIAWAQDTRELLERP
jgi:hypothetical protein